MVNKNCIWVNALAAKYCRGTNLLKAREYHGASWFWHNLMHTRDIVEVGFCWSIKTGYTSKLKWGTTVERHLNHVSDLIDENTTTWKEDLIREIFEENLAAAILSVPLTPSNSPDTPRWILSAKGSSLSKTLT